MRHLGTHALDTMNGRPAAGRPASLQRLHGGLAPFLGGLGGALRVSPRAYGSCRGH
jgi:hypothetical protein